MVEATSSRAATSNTLIYFCVIDWIEMTKTWNVSKSAKIVWKGFTLMPDFANKARIQLSFPSMGLVHGRHTDGVGSEGKRSQEKMAR